jgi:hypothetical protein
MIVGIAEWVIFAVSFKVPKCDHVFTRVEQANVKIEPFSISLGSSGYASGLKEGNELICVKCFHMQKQMLDYGKLDLFTLAVNDTTLTKFFSCDSILTMGSSGLSFIKGDTLIWSK